MENTEIYKEYYVGRRVWFLVKENDSYALGEGNISLVGVINPDGTGAVKVEIGKRYLELNNVYFDKQRAIDRIIEDTRNRIKLKEDYINYIRDI